MTLCESILRCLSKTRGVSVDVHLRTSTIQVVSEVSKALTDSHHVGEAEALQQASSKCCGSPEYGGLGMSTQADLTEPQIAEVLFQIEAYLQAITSRELAKCLRKPEPNRDERTKPMTLAQKIFAHHAIDGCDVGGLPVADIVRVAIDWIMASELSYRGIQKTLDEVGDPEIFRNDRFWLAGDHVYDPRIAHEPRVQAMYNAAETAKKKYKMTEYQGMNYTIMHTEFVRERAQPGMLVIGADSHTCSAGAVGCLAIGLGAVDVAMALCTGKTWFKVPESIRIDFTGKPSFGISGKDVILHILKVLKRNTVAAERIVEFSGPGLQWLSVDARFAISNMCTEFGAVTGIFCPDEVTQNYVNRRPLKANKSEATYFKMDEDAPYAATFEINLSQVEPTIALYPNPDDVVPLSERPSMKFDGVFIGACTTTEEEHILAALVLKVGLAKNFTIVPGKRHVVPGSRPIAERLKKMGLLDVYESAGFSIGLPGCSYCVGMAADQAGKGERWLSSQNRNFRNRMGPGSIGNITSAAVVAASSFSMSLASPVPLIAEIDQSIYQCYKQGLIPEHPPVVQYVEPCVGSQPLTTKTPHDGHTAEKATTEESEQQIPAISSRVITLEDFIDTDALAPAMVLSTAKDDKEFGEHCLEYTHPEFRQQVRDGRQIVVAGKAFGVGSSREEAVRALMGLGVKAVIAKSFAFIYSRNQPSLGLLGIVIEEESFYDVATDDVLITIDIQNRRVHVGEGPAMKEFSFTMPEMEYRLVTSRGINAAYGKFRNKVWEHMVADRSYPPKAERTTFDAVGEVVDEPGGIEPQLQW